MAIRRLVEDFEIVMDDVNIVKIRALNGTYNGVSFIPNEPVPAGFCSIDLFRSKSGREAFCKSRNEKEKYPGEYIVINDFGCSPRVGESEDQFINVRICRTQIFMGVNGEPSVGIRGLLVPYPETDSCRKRFSPPTYCVLPGQTWEVVLTLGTMIKNVPVRAFIEYTLYDGSDADICKELFDKGIWISPDSVEAIRKERCRQIPG